MSGFFDDGYRLFVAVLVVGTGLVGGVFFAFSTFVMPALHRLPAKQGIAAMQAINVAAITPPFMVALFGTGAACLGAAVISVRGLARPGAAWVLAGSMLCVLGSVVVTIVANVPWNDALAAVDPASADGTQIWESYQRSWVRWNHVRTITTLLASGLLVVALTSDT